MELADLQAGGSGPAGQDLWTRDGRKLRMLNVVDEFTRECLAIRVARKLIFLDVIDVLTDLFIARATAAHVRSDNGPEFVAKAVQGWIHGVGVKAASIEPGSPWENGYVESFDGKLRDELLDGEVFNALAVLIQVAASYTTTWDTTCPPYSQPCGEGRGKVCTLVRTPRKCVFAHQSAHFLPAPAWADPPPSWDKQAELPLGFLQ